MASENTPTLVINPGSYNFKGGIAGKEGPSVVIRTKGTQPDKVPYKEGFIKDVDGFNQLISSIYDKLKLKSNENSLLFTEPSIRFLEARKEISVQAFENFNAPRISFVQEPVAILQYKGLTTGMAVTIGHSLITWLPIYSGFAVDHAAGSLNFAGEKITQKLYELIQKKYPKVNMNPSFMDSITKIKEDHCYFSENFLGELQSTDNHHNIERFCELSDGTPIQITSERFVAPEVLFKPSLLARECLGIHDQIADSIMATPISMRRSLVDNIIISSPFTESNGFPFRLRNSMEFEIPEFSDVFSGLKKFQTVGCGSDAFPEWKGAAKWVIENGSFDQIWISKEEYDESGPAITSRKCF